MADPKDNPAEKRLEDAEVQRWVRELVAAGAIAWRDHAERAMLKRGWSKDQAKECLAKGVFEERPFVPNRPGPIQYEFAMRARVDGEDLKVAASLIPDSRVVVITIKNRRSRG